MEPSVWQQQSQLEGCETDGRIHETEECFLVDALAEKWMTDRG
jgi:hypothetical protein